MDRGSLRQAWFIRHGESVANAGARTREASGVPLSERGFRQAEQLARALPRHVDLVVKSPYVRAHQSAAPYLQQATVGKLEEWPIQEVQYLDPSLCVDTTQEERRALAIDYWEKADAHFAAPMAESFVAFIGRAELALQKLLERSEPRTLLFCHGQFMGAVMWLILTRPAHIDCVAMRRFYRFIHGFTVPNCSVLPVYLHDDGGLSMAGLRVPEGVETEGAELAGAGLAGL